MGTWMEGTWGWPRMRTWGPGWGDGGGGDTLGWGHLGMGTWMGETWGQQGLGTGGALWWRQRGAWTQGQGTNWDGGGHIGTSVTWGQGSGDTPPASSPHPLSVLQEEQDPVLPPDILAMGTTSPLRHPPTWPNTLDGFPPAWPVAAAITRHCSQPPRPPPTLQLPSTAFAHLRRQAAALDAFRPRLNACCHHHTPLPCARHAVSPRAWGGGGGRDTQSVCVQGV